MKLLEWLTPKKYVGSPRQIAFREKIEALKADTLAKAKANNGFFVPSGFLQESGALGATLLHQSLRELQADDKIKKTAHDGWGEKWIAT